jgi:chitodextrinase
MKKESVLFLLWILLIIIIYLFINGSLKKEGLENTGVIAQKFLDLEAQQSISIPFNEIPDVPTTKPPTPTPSINIYSRVLSNLDGVDIGNINIPLNELQSFPVTTRSPVSNPIKVGIPKNVTTFPSRNEVINSTRNVTYPPVTTSVPVISFTEMVPEISKPPVTSSPGSNNYALTTTSPPVTSPPTTTTALPLPETPEDVYSTASQKSVSINFTVSMTKVDEYCVYYEKTLVGKSKTTPINIDGLTENSDYSFLITAVNQTGESKPSEPIVFKTLPKIPDAPQNVNYSNLTHDSVTIDFISNTTTPSYMYTTTPASKPDADTTITAYRIYSENKVIAEGAILPITVNNLAVYTKYSLYVTAVNISGESPKSKEISFKTSPYVPTSPTGLTSSNVTQTTATLSFITPSGAVDKFNIYLKGALVGSTASSPFVIDNLTQNTSYKFTVAVVNIAGESPQSEVLVINTLPNIPDKVTNVSSSDVGTNSLVLKFDKSASKVDKYNIFLKNDTDKLVATTPTDSVVISNLKAYTQYYFVVIAVNTGGESQPSDIYNVTTLPYPPNSPTDLKVTKTTSSSVTIRFTPPPDDPIQYYNVYSNDKLLGTGPTSPITITDLTAYTTYNLNLVAVHAGGISQSSLSIRVTTLPGVPSLPTAVEVTNITQTSANLTFKNPNKTFTYFDVTINDGYVEIGDSSSPINITDLPANTSYTYVMTATNTGGKATGTITGTFTTLPNVSNTPAGLTALKVTQSTASIGFVAPSDNIDYYSVYSNDVVIAKTSQIPIVVSNLSENTSHSFTITATNSGGTSPPSKPLVIKTLPAALKTPTNLKASAITQTSLNLNFDPVEGIIDSYNVFLGDTQILQGKTSPISLGNLTPNTTFVFTLTASNAAGSSPKSTALTVSTLPNIPDPPTGLKASNIKQNSIELAFTPSYSVVDNYAIFAGNDFVMDTNISPVTITGLSFYTDYYFKIISSNLAGSSIPSSVLKITTLPEVPRSPLDLAASSITQTSFILNFKPPSGPINSYTVYAGGKQIATSSSFPITVTGLTQYTKYDITITATSISGTSPVSASLSIMTTPNIPNPPSNLTISNVSQSSLLISFTPPVENVTNYIVYANSIEVARGTTTPISVNNLVEYTQYSFTVMAVNTSGNSSKSSAIGITTLPDLPTAPSNVIISNLTQTSLSVNFSSPPGPITGYIIESYDKVIGSGKKSPVILNNLTPNTLYSLSVNAVDIVGNTAESSYVNVTTLPNISDLVTALVLSNISQTSATLSFTPPSGPVDSYVIYNGTTALMTASSQPVVVNGLLAYNEYLINVIAINKGGSSAPSAPIKLKTLADIPGVPSALSSSNITQTSVTISFTTPTGPVNAYNIFSNNAKIATCTASPVTINNLTSNTQYSFSITASVESGSSNASCILTITTLPNIPDAPTGLIATRSTQSSGAFGFTPPTGPVDSYGVYIDKQYIMPWSASLPSPITVNNLDVNSSYNLRLVAINKGGISQLSDPVIVSTLPNVPKPVTNVKSSAITQTTALISFDKPSEPVDKYVLFSGKDIIMNGDDPLHVTASPFTVTGLTAYTAYQFVVVGTNKAGSSTPSAIVKINTLPNVPNSPSNIAVANVTQTSMSISFTPPSGEVTNYIILLNNNEYDTSKTSPVSINNLTPNTLYTVSVEAVNEGGKTAPSSPLKVTTLPIIPLAVTNVTTSNITQSSVTISFSVPTGPVDSYAVYTGSTFVASSPTAPVSVNGLTPNTAYSYTLVAINKGGTSPASSAISITTLPNMPCCPTALIASDVTQTTMTISFTGCSGVIDTYALYTGTTFIMNSTTTSFKLTNLAVYTPYSYNVVASNKAGLSSPSSPIQVTTLPNVPSFPTGLTASNISQMSVTISFTPCSGPIDNYVIYSGNSVVSNTTSSTTVINSLTPNTSYSFTVTATNKAGTSLKSSVLSFNTLPNAPLAPSGLTASKITQTTLVIAFTAPSGPVDTYSLYSGTTFVTNPTASPFSVTNLKSYSSYSFTLIATNKSGASPASVPLTVTTLIDIPNAPTNLSAKDITQIGATISFTPPSTSVVSYDLLANGNKVTTITSSPFNVTGLTANTNYSLTITATGTSGSSVASGAVNVMTLPVLPDPPSNFTTSNVTQTTITLSFTPPSQAVEIYTVYLNNSVIKYVTSSPVTVENLTMNTSYFFNITSMNKGGTSKASPSLIVNTLPNIPVAPSNLLASNVTQTSIAISFTPPPGLVTNYTVLANNTLSSTITATTFTMNSLKPNTVYSFTIKANNPSGSSEVSTALAVTTLPDIPPIPTGLTATNITQTSFTINFTPSSGIISNYYAYISNTAVGSCAGTASSIIINNLTAKYVYGVRILASNIAGKSNLSEELAVKTLDNPPSAPTTLLGYSNGLYFKVFSGYHGDNVNYDTNQSYSSGFTNSIASLTTGTGGIRKNNDNVVVTVFWYGYFLSDYTGTWTFTLSNDDQVAFWMGPYALSGYTIQNANMWSTCCMTPRSFTLQLTANTFYPMRIMFGNGGGPGDIQLSWSRPGISATTNGDNYFYSNANNRATTSAYLTFNSANAESITKYMIYANGNLLLDNVTTNMTLLNSLSPGTNYSLTCVAVNSGGNSQQSAAYVFNTAIIPRKYNLKKSQDFPGNDISYWVGPFSGCEAACDSTPGCVAYTKHLDNGSNCWLKGSARNSNNEGVRDTHVVENTNEAKRPYKPPFGEWVRLDVFNRPNMCIDNGGGWTGSKNTIFDCGDGNTNQGWLHNKDNKLWSSLSRGGRCMDDGGGGRGSEFRLWDCNEGNTNQHFLYDDVNRTLYNPNKNLCLTTGIGNGGNGTQAYLDNCDTNNLNQRVDVSSFDGVSNAYMILGVGMDNNLYWRQSLGRNWRGGVNNACCIVGVTQLQDGRIVGIGTNGTLFWKIRINTNWVYAGDNTGTVKSVSQLKDGRIIGVGGDNKIYIRDTLSTPWVYGGDNTCCVTSISVYNDGTVVGVGTDSRLWTKTILTPPIVDDDPINKDKLLFRFKFNKGDMVNNRLFNYANNSYGATVFNCDDNSFSGDAMTGGSSLYLNGDKQYVNIDPFYTSIPLNSSVMYVRIEPMGDADWLQIAQLVVNDSNGTRQTPINISATNPCCDTNVNKPLDGHYGPRHHPGEYHSDARNAFYELKFNSFTLGSIFVYNRSDCCWDRLAGYKITIKNSGGTVLASVPLTPKFVQKYYFSDANTALTISSWFKFPTDNHGWRRLFDFGNYSDTQNILYAPGNGIAIRNTANSNTNQNMAYATGYVDDKWHLFTWVMNYASTTWNVYIDSNLVYNGSGPYPAPCLRMNNYIGFSNWQADGMSRAFFNDFRIYNRALSGDEVKTLFNYRGTKTNGLLTTRTLQETPWIFRGDNTCCVKASAQTPDGTIIGVGFNNALFTKRSFEDDWVYAGDHTAAVYAICVYTPPPALPDTLLSDQKPNTLFVNDVLVSADRRWYLVMQYDSNLCAYPVGGGGAYWCSNTSGKGGTRVVMQTDGNFVMYNASNSAVWATNTAGSGNNPFRFIMQNDGNIVIYGVYNGVLWSSNTGGR